MNCCEVLTPQEQRIQEELQGKETFYGRERAYKILNTFKNERPIIDIERA
ncbi:hypothetical protein GGQ84_003083, partial [Desulfitispora alkaliphila]